MPFGVVRQLGPKMRQIVRFVIVPWQGTIFGVDVGHPIVTSGDFVA